MSTRTTSRFRLLRDIRSASALFVWTAFIFAILINLFDWPSFLPAIAMRSKVDPIAPKHALDMDKIYTGSIYFVPSSGDYCLQRMIDNRTGNMWDNGSVNCDELARAIGQPRRNTLGAERVRAIGAALRHDGN